MSLLDKGSKRNLKDTKIGKIIYYQSGLLALYCVYATVFAHPHAIMYRGLFTMSLVALAMIRYSTPGDKSGKIKTIDYVLAVLSLITGLYIILSNERLVFRTPFFDPILPLDIVFGTIAILLVLEATRRTVGYPLAIVALIMMATFSANTSRYVRTQGFTFERLIEQMFLTTNGIFGGSVGIASSYVLMFVIFGEFLTVLVAVISSLISHELLPALLAALGQTAVVASALLVQYPEAPFPTWQLPVP